VWQLWIDLETTGLDPGTGRILEIGALVADPSGAEVACWDTVVGCPTAAARALCAPEVWDMHTASGLIDECAASTVHEGAAVLALQDWVDQVVPGREQIVMAGSGLQFDLRWMRHRREWLRAIDLVATLTTEAGP
jgi:oligoribonuclease (3'-5' exoribonuclease)